MSVAEYAYDLECTRTLYDRMKKNADGAWDIPQDLQQDFSELGYLKQYDNIKKAYILSQLDDEKTVALAKEKIIYGWLPMVVFICKADLDGMRRFHATLNDNKAEQEQRYSELLDWAHRPLLLSDGHKINTVSTDVLRQLFEWGANLSSIFAGSKPFETVLREGGSDTIGVFLEYGGDADTVLRIKSELWNDKHRINTIDRALSIHGLYTKVDSDIICKLHQSADITLKTLFNFKAGRVHEVVHMNGNMAMTSTSFAEYDNIDEIEKAREQLIRLGGTPSDITARISKSQRFTTGLALKSKV